MLQPKSDSRQRLMIDLDDISAKKRIAAEEHAAKRRAKSADRRAARELEADRKREIDEADRAAARATQRANQLERQAQRLLKDRASRRNPLADVARIFTKPGIRTAAGLANQKAQKQTNRPAGTNGAVSFHFQVSAVSKAGQLAAVLKGRKSAAAALSGGAPHQRYIERDDAPEVVRARSMQAYIEDQTKAEQVAPDGVEISSFGNIADTKEERERFWEAVDASERDPRATKVVLDPSESPEVWAKVRTQVVGRTDTPSSLSLALSVGYPVAETVSEEESLRLVQIFQKAGFTKIAAEQNVEDVPSAPISFVVGRGGRVQTRIVVELPHEMTPAQRLALAKDYCQPFANQSLPHWAVIHAPNQHNDDRNYHLHVNLYDRPAKRIEHPDRIGSGEMIWDFTYLHEFKTARRQTRTNRPFAQPKVEAMSKASWVWGERDRFAKFANAHLEAAGIEKRHDPRTYKEMGVQEQARERMPPASYARERKGLETEQGLKLADKQWQTNKESVAAIAKADASYEVYRRAWLKRALAEQRGRQTVEARLAYKAGSEIARLSARKTELVTERNAWSHVAAKMESRSRLKSKKTRDEVDEAAIAVSAEMKQAVSDIDNRIRHLIEQIRKAERLFVKAKKIDDATIRAENYEKLTRAMRGMTALLLEEAAIETPEVTTPAIARPMVQSPARQAAQPAKEAPAVAQPAAKPAADLVGRVRDVAKTIAAERRAAAGQSEPASPPAATSPKPARPAPAPMSAAIAPRPLAKEPQPGTPVASNPARPKPLTDEEKMQREKERLAQLQKRMSITRQRARAGRER